MDLNWVTGMIVNGRSALDGQHYDSSTGQYRALTGGEKYKVTRMVTRRVARDEARRLARRNEQRMAEVAYAAQQQRVSA